MGTFVTLAEVLEARGSPLEEDEVWCLLLASQLTLLKRFLMTKSFVSVALWPLGSGNMCSVLSPGSVLLSANGSVLSNIGISLSLYCTAVNLHNNMEIMLVLQMVVYSLGMTLYWCVDYQLPQNQPVQLSAELEGLLLSMCEEVCVRRPELLTVLESCELHQKAAMLPPAQCCVRQLVEDVCRSAVSHWSSSQEMDLQQALGSLQPSVKPWFSTGKRWFALSGWMVSLCLKWRSSSISGSCSRVREGWSVRLTGGSVQRLQ
uniref:KIND domain-containing protein n=1 Tax=Periophthalmus magnuspinnatus TaxID=409849 RepID=A0A3B3ZVG5_9GOBI